VVIVSVVAVTTLSVTVFVLASPAALIAEQ
jgi:hypothetical protein